MQRLNNLAFKEPSDVVALTGDVVSESNKQLPAAWDSWPQKLKLSVPGNHGDHSHAYDCLPSWCHNTPWARRLDELLFIGLPLLEDRVDLELTARGIDQRNTKGVVLLSHRHPKLDPNHWLTASIMRFIDRRMLLILHGDEHPGDFGTEWDESLLDGMPYTRSNACSAARRRRGLANLITWHRERFSGKPVQGEL